MVKSLYKNAGFEVGVFEKINQGQVPVLTGPIFK